MTIRMNRKKGWKLKVRLKKKKKQGYVEDAEAKNLDEFKLDDPSQEELKVTEKEELTEDDLEGAGRCSGTGQYRNWPPFHQLPRATLTYTETGRRSTVEDLL